ncbi:DUF4436 family protein [Paramicrobacterium chengjingii]|uniref:DUF4436 family protein n=1 Tax=Paramicrobacterium chengjingii TaxID=2769067 RepID=A0ABX6YK33_9MICO|nr:DUF4436 family protein [Microbacterium chengjingii]QPZ39164.1 DUF4436 family protein [Microbacterium chengjingii]
MTVETLLADNGPDEPDEAPPPKKRRNPAPWILSIAVVLLIVYYILVSVSGALNLSATVPFSGSNTATSANYLTLQMKVQDIDLTNRQLQANVLPVPHGTLVGDKAGEMSRSLRIEVASGGVTTSVVTYPGESIVDPTALTLSLDRGDSTYPLDEPYANFQLSVRDEQTGEPIPFVVDLENSARPWILAGTIGDANIDADGVHYPVSLDGHRDVLSIALVAFYLLAILLTTLMAVVTIGSALLRHKLEFSNVIWLSATMLSFPALRSAMPGAPPIGTALDFIVLFPCIALVAVMLVWTGGYMLWRESTILRRRALDEEADA